MPSHSQQESEVNAERPDVGSRLARDPEDGEVTVVVELDELALVDGSDPELALDGGDERGTLEEGAGEGFETPSEGFFVGEGGVEADDADVFLSCDGEWGA